MPKEMLLGNKKSDWYNPSIDVFSIAVSFVEFLYHYWENDINTDIGLIYILEAALYDNRCYHSQGVTQCMNSDYYYQKFHNLYDIVRYF